MSAKEVALGNEVLRGVVGSTALGTALEGTDDRDEMGVFVEPPEYVCGMTPCDHYIQRDQPDGVRSQPGDLDLTLYSLRKFCRLAAQGNPSILIVLWLPDHLIKTSIGEQLLSMRSAFFSRDAGERFLGYLISQRMALTGERNKRVSRPELVEKYGYDTKFAMHAVRLGLEGIEYMTERRLTLPHPAHERELLMGIRTGQLAFGEVLKVIEGVEVKLRALTDACEVGVNRPQINRFLVAAHEEHWNARR